MSQQLVDHSPDLKRLRDEGYEIEIQHGFLLVYHIPYLNQSGQIQYGVLASQLILISNNKTARPSNHVVEFQGEHPCDKHGRPIEAIRHASLTKILFANFQTNHTFSNKPPNGYADYYALVSNYAEIISAPARSLDASVTFKTFKPVVDHNPDSVFQYIDSNSSRANIHMLTEKLANQKVGILGLGGTGAYILDLVAKAPVREIHLYDGDSFLQHNAFRSPGAVSVDMLDQHMKKVNYYKTLYSNIHKNIAAHDTFISDENLDSLKGMSCVFIAIDTGSVKRHIIDYLIQSNIPFIDVGIGVNKVDDQLIGMVRVTTGTATKNDHLQNRIPMVDDPNNLYNDNIQIAELNSLNAALAVIKWKKMCGFYNDLEREHHSTYSINVAQLLNDDLTT